MGADGVRLVPFDESHLEEVERLIDDPEILRRTRISEPPPPGFPRQWLARYEEGRREGTREAFAAVDDDGALLGLALAPSIDREAGEVELGYMVGTWARGRGVASAMLAQLTRWAFDVAGAQRAYLIINVDNAASVRVAERCGYVREGVMRSIHLKDDLRVDASLWSRLPSDP